MYVSKKKKQKGKKIACEHISPGMGQLGSGTNRFRDECLPGRLGPGRLDPAKNLFFMCFDGFWRGVKFSMMSIVVQDLWIHPIARRQILIFIYCFSKK